MQYRVIKTAYRNEDTGEITYRFYPEYSYVTKFRKREKWANFTTLVGGFSHSWRETVSFKVEKDAVDFVERMREPVPADEVVYPKDHTHEII